MKTFQMNLDPRYWMLVVAASLIVLVAFLTGCTTTKEIQKEAIQQQTQIQTVEEIQTTTNTETKTDTRESSETTTTETYDTVVRVTPVVDGKVGKEISIPIKGKRTTHRKEFINSTQEKNEQMAENQKSEALVGQNTKSSATGRQVTRTGFPAWLVIMLIIAAIIGAFILLWRLKLFRFPP